MHRISAPAYLFQAFIEKQCDLRAILIGNEVLATEFYPLSEATRVDFRADYSALICTSYLLAINRAYHLVYAAIDLVYTPNGHDVFLELHVVGHMAGSKVEAESCSSIR